MNFLENLDLIIILSYLVGIFIIGLIAGRKIVDLKDYAIANHSYSSFVLFATLSASFIGGGFSFGNADTVFQKGIGPATALWGFSLMMILVAIFIAPRIGKFKGCISAGDIMFKNFGKSGQLTAGILGMCVCTGILGAQIGAMGAVFETFTPLNFQQGILIGCSIVIVYTSFGGMKAVVLTDVIQFLMLVVFIPLTLIMGIMHVGGIEALEQKVPSNFFDITSASFTPIMWVSLFLSFLIGETFVPPYIQRLLIAKTPKATARGTLLSGLLSVPFFIITGMLGIVALAINPEISSSSAMPSVINTVLPIGIKSLACAAIISIVMSSADSFLNSATVCLLEDVIKPLMNKTHLKKELLYAKILSLIIGVSSTIVAVTISNVLDILRFAYNFWAPIMVVPLAYILLGLKAPQKSFIGGAIAGAIVIISAWSINGASILYGIDAIVLGAAANLLVFNLFRKI